MADHPQTGTPPAEIQAEVDARGLRCPEPLMLARTQMRKLASGQVLYVQATDPTTDHDLAQFCHYMGHSMLFQRRTPVDDPELFEYWLGKA